MGTLTSFHTIIKILKNSMKHYGVKYVLVKLLDLKIYIDRNKTSEDDNHFVVETCEKYDKYWFGGYFSKFI